MWYNSYKVLFMDTIIGQIGLKIKQYRKKRGFTQAQLAELINVDPKYISRLETGTSTPSIATIVRLSEVLEAEMFNFFIFDTTKEKERVIELINSKLDKANVKELHAIFDIVSVITEK